MARMLVVDGIYLLNKTLAMRLVIEQKRFFTDFSDKRRYIMTLQLPLICETHNRRQTLQQYVLRERMLNTRMPFSAQTRAVK